MRSGPVWGQCPARSPRSTTANLRCVGVDSVWGCVGIHLRIGVMFGLIGAKLLCFTSSRRDAELFSSPTPEMLQPAVGTHRVAAAEIVADLLTPNNISIDRAVAAAKLVPAVVHLALSHPLCSRWPIPGPYCWHLWEHGGHGDVCMQGVPVPHLFRTHCLTFYLNLQYPPPCHLTLISSLHVRALRVIRSCLRSPDVPDLCMPMMTLPGWGCGMTEPRWMLRGLGIGDPLDAAADDDTEAAPTASEETHGPGTACRPLPDLLAATGKIQPRNITHQRCQSEALTLSDQCPRWG